MPGKLVTYVGVMGSGKTDKLIKMYKDFHRNGINAMIFKPTKDTRTRPTVVQSRSGAVAPATPIQSVYDIYEYEGIYQKAILIDEVQFLDQPDLITSLLAICLTGIDVYCFGLDLTSDGTTFGKMGELMVQSDEVIKLKCKCSRCDNLARISMYKGNDKNSDVKIGDLDVYEPVCRDCFYEEKIKHKDDIQFPDDDPLYYFQIGSKQLGFRMELTVKKSSLEEAGYTYEDVIDINTLEGANNLLQDLGLIDEDV